MEHNGFEYIDLGLPSGTLWATCDVGANSPCQHGLYFQWGDTIGYTSNDIKNGIKAFNHYWKDCKFRKGNGFSKYNTRDKKLILDLEDDAAHANMGGDWMMPTRNDITELKNCTNIFSSDISGVNCIILRSKFNNKELFIVKSGYADDGGVHWLDEDAIIMSNTLTRGCISSSSVLHMYDDAISVSNFYRKYGFSVRGVLKNVK